MGETAKYRGMVLMPLEDGSVEWLVPGDEEVRGRGTNLANAKYLIDSYLDHSGILQFIDYEVKQPEVMN